MRNRPLLLLPLFLLSACGDEKTSGDDGTTTIEDDGTTSADTDEPADSGEPGDTGDTGDTGETDPEPEDADGDGFTDDVDCDDTNADIFPGATEWVDGLDNDCDPETTEDGLATWWAADGPVDVTDTLANGGEWHEWTTPSDGTLSLGTGTWPASVHIAEGHTVAIDGHGEALLSAPSAYGLEVSGDAVVRNLSVEAYESTVRMNGSLDAADVHFVNSGLRAFQSTTVDLERITIDAGGFPTIRSGGDPDGPREVTVRDSDITGESWGVSGFSDLTIEDSTIQSTGTSLYVTGTTTVSNTVITSTSQPVVVGSSSSPLPEAQLSMHDTTVQGYRGIVTYAETSTTLTDVTVEADGYPLNASGGTVTVVRGTYTTTTGTPLIANGSAAALSITLQDVETNGATWAVVSASGDTTLLVEDMEFVDGPYSAVSVDLASTGSATVRRCTFDGNVTAGTGSQWRGYGGALWFKGGHTLTVEDSTFTNNYAPYDGGAVFVHSGDLVLSGNTFTGNEGRNGGAIRVLTEGAFTSVGDTFDGNIASSHGAVYAAGDLSMEDAVVTSNTSGWGAAVATSGALWLSGTWDFGSAGSDNTPADFYWATTGESVEVAAGSGSLVCGYGEAACAGRVSP